LEPALHGEGRRRFAELRAAHLEGTWPSRI
jgi:hypothetical protein